MDVASDGAGGVWFVYGDAVWHMNKPGDRPSVYDLPGARELVLGGGRVWAFTGDTFASFDPVTGRSRGTVSIERCTCSSIAYFEWAGRNSQRKEAGRYCQEGSSGTMGDGQ